MKIIAAFAFLALACAAAYSETVRVAPPLPEVPASAESVKIAEPNYKDIPAFNPPPFDPNMPVRRSDVANTFDENAPQHYSPIDMGMILVPEEVMRAVAAADAINAEPVPLFPSLMPGDVMPESEDILAVKFVDSPMEPEQVQRAAPLIAEAPEEMVQPLVLPEPAVPYVVSEDVAFQMPMEPEQSIRIAPSELDAVIVEKPRVLPIEMQIPAMPVIEAEDNLAVQFVDSPMEPEQVKMAAPLELGAARIMEVPSEVDQPEQFVNIAEMPALLQNWPRRVYNNPTMRGFPRL